MFLTFCFQCGTENPENSAYCYNCGQKVSTPKPGQPPSSIDPLILARERALARVIVARENGLATQADVEKVIQEIRQDIAQNEKIREAAARKLMHLHFFTAVDHNGVTRLFDIMEKEDIFSLA